MTANDPVERSWDLSLYELHRTPQEAITDDTEIAVSARSLQSELTCPICLDMLTNTMTTKECLHRFCAECIVTALRSGNKECPTCRKKLVSKRSLRPDPNFDQLVEKIFPNREEYEAHQESILDSISRSHSQNFITSIKDGIKAQMAHAKAVNRKKNNDDYEDSPHHDGTQPITGGDQGQGDDYENAPLPPPKKKKNKIKPPTSLNSSGVGINPDADGNATDDNSGASGAATQEVEIVFKLHPEMLADIAQKDAVKAMKDNATRYIKTTSRALVEHLCKYLAMRIALDLAKTTSAASTQASTSSTTSATEGGTAPPPPPLPTAAAAPTSDGTTSASSATAAAAVTSAASAGGSVKDLTIFIASVPGQLTPLTPSLSLTEVNEKYWKVNKPLEMFYRFTRV